MNRLALLALFLALLCARTALGNDLVRRTWQVAGFEREALVHSPSNSGGGPVPLVFVFHGHGGGMRQVASAAPVEKYWPEAIVVYPQGLPTVGQLTDPSGNKNGWQPTAGAEGDRDLRFFDAILSSLKADYQVDPKRIYVTGHSNGGSFTYLLWQNRPDVFAAYGPSSAIAIRGVMQMRPSPVIHIAGRNDPLVKFAWQERMIEALKRIDQCGPAETQGNGTVLYPSKIGAPVMTYVHSGTHASPPEATALIVAFFKAHPKP